MAIVPATKSICIDDLIELPGCTTQLATRSRQKIQDPAHYADSLGDDSGKLFISITFGLMGDMIAKGDFINGHW